MYIKEAVLFARPFISYLSGTILFVGLRKDEQVGLDLLRSELESVKDNRHEPVKYLI